MTTKRTLCFSAAADRFAADLQNSLSGDISACHHRSRLDRPDDRVFELAYDQRV
jgi:hypothetical protein